VKARRTNTPPAADSTRIATDSTRPSGRFTMPFPVAPLTVRPASKRDLRTVPAQQTSRRTGR
jgi:hypothetical protein